MYVYYYTSVYMYMNTFELTNKSKTLSEYPKGEEATNFAGTNKYLLCKWPVNNNDKLILIRISANRWKGKELKVN